MNNAEKARELIEKYLSGECSGEEKALVERFYLDQFKEGKLPEGLPADGLKADMWKQVSETTQPKKGRLTTLPWLRIAAAVALFVLVGTSLFFLTKNRFSEPSTKTAFKNDIAPGGNRATLTLAGGQTIALSEAQSGIIVNEGITYADGTAVLTDSLQPDEGLKSHLPAGKAGISNLLSISTPRGGQYQVVLPDGTKVWLNAASSLSYPASFAGQADRRVELTGEAYFEVAKDKDKPFIVKTDQQQVEVLGTHFNINSYSNEQVVKTTLLEGSVKVSHLNTHISHPLSPGQQAILSDNKINVKEVAVEIAVAWKNEKFMFDNEDISSIMRMVERWYNVEVIYEGEKTTDKFGGSVSRFDKVSKVLSILELTGKVHFRVEGRKIYVSK